MSQPEMPAAPDPAPPTESLPPSLNTEPHPLPAVEDVHAGRTEAPGHQHAADALLQDTMGDTGDLTIPEVTAETTAETTAEATAEAAHLAQSATSEGLANNGEQVNIIQLHTSLVTDERTVTGNTHALQQSSLVEYTSPQWPAHNAVPAAESSAAAPVRRSARLAANRDSDVLYALSESPKRRGKYSVALPIHVLGPLAGTSIVHKFLCEEPGASLDRLLSLKKVLDMNDPDVVKELDTVKAKMAEMDQGNATLTLSRVDKDLHNGENLSLQQRFGTPALPAQGRALGEPFPGSMTSQVLPLRVADYEMHGALRGTPTPTGNASNRPMIVDRTDDTDMIRDIGAPLAARNGVLPTSSIPDGMAMHPARLAMLATPQFASNTQSPVSKKGKNKAPSNSASATGANGMAVGRQKLVPLTQPFIPAKRARSGSADEEHAEQYHFTFFAENHLPVANGFQANALAPHASAAAPRIPSVKRGKKAKKVKSLPNLQQHSQYPIMGMLHQMVIDQLEQHTSGKDLVNAFRQVTAELERRYFPGLK